ncbi:conserved hypothetical protein [Geotrichum candidum]|uniref:Glycosyltransferase subfamily 4-like N-terminal domain-containing protein n=1 Tax=Geotrichum candidum TaxID=1173061 RepID=A0A0J9XEB2_GEOCN|nr:conserved hypothetical protein [Geotrichum candidum]
MKVAIITEVSTLHINGVSKTITKLLDYLIAHGHEAIVLGPQHGSYQSVKLVGTVGVPLFFYPELKLSFVSYNLVCSLIAFKPDVIHFVDPNLLGPQMLLACKLFLPRVPIVSSYHTNIAFYASIFGFGFLYEPIWATHRLYHGSSKYVLCPSYSTKEELIKHGFDSDNIKVWSRGVNASLFNPNQRCFELRSEWLRDSVPSKVKCLSETPKQHRSDSTSSTDDEGVSFGLDKQLEKTILLYVGRISWEKNLRVLVDAYLKMNHELFHLVIVGDGPARKSIKTLLTTTTNDGQSHCEASFTGYLKGEALAKAYASADIFVFPSVSETFGQVVLEAQASGLPVVAMNAEGVKEIVKDQVSGFLVDPDNCPADGFQQAIESIAFTGQIADFSKNALKRSGEFTWENSMNTCINAYNDAVNQ